MGPRASLSVGRDRGVDEAGVDRGEVVEAQPTLFQVAGCERLDEHVGATGEIAERLGAVGAVDVEDGTALVEAVGGPEQASFGVFNTVDERPPATGTGCRPAARS